MIFVMHNSNIFMKYYRKKCSGMKTATSHRFSAGPPPFVFLNVLDGRWENIDIEDTVTLLKIR